MGPLEGVRVVELQGIGPGPFCGMMLADMGAEIIRVDRSASVGQEANKTDFLARGRKSIGVDLKNPQGVETVFCIVTSIATLFGTAPSVIVKVVPETVKAVIAVPSSLTVNAAALSAAVPNVKTLVDPSPVKLLTTLLAVFDDVCGSTSVVILSTSACVT